jgi:hypothetical protein
MENDVRYHGKLLSGEDIYPSHPLSSGVQVIAGSESSSDSALDAPGNVTMDTCRCESTICIACQTSRTLSYMTVKGEIMMFPSILVRCVKHG